MKKALPLLSLILGSMCFTACGLNDDNHNTKPDEILPDNPSDDNKPNDNLDNEEAKPNPDEKPNVPEKPDNPLNPDDPDDSKDPINPDKPNDDENNNKPEPKPLPEIDHIKVLVKDPIYTHCYAWNKINNKTITYTKKFPGDLLQNFNDEWKCFDFNADLESVNLLFNNGGSQKQTCDLFVSGAGYHWFDSKNNTFKKSNFLPGVDEPSKPLNPDEGNTPDYNPITAKSYKEFAIWDKMDKNPSYYKVQNPYKGERKDFREETIYFAITTRFYDGDKSNNKYTWKGYDNNKRNNDPDWRGDFKGLIEKLDYIKALGFTSIWITPVVENTSESDFHGYHASDFSKVDTRYESQDVKFEDLIKEVHKRDMKLILDIVINHTSNYGEANLLPLVKKKANQNPEKSDDVESLGNGNLNPNDVNNWQKRIEALSDRNKNIYHENRGVGSWTGIDCQLGRIAGDCVDLNTENPIVANYLVECYGEFIRLGVDAFRIDTFKHVSRLTWNNYYLPSFYEYAKRVGNDNFFTFGEVLTGGGSDYFENNNATVSAPFFTWKESNEYPWGDVETNIESTKTAFEELKPAKIQPKSDNAFLKDNFEYHAPDHKNFSGASVIDTPMHFNFDDAKEAFRKGVQGDKYFNDSTYNIVYVDSHDRAPNKNEKVRFNGGTDTWAENLSLMFTFRGIPCIYYGSEIEFQKGKIIDNYNMPLKDTGRAYFGDYLTGNIQTTDFGEFKASGKISETLNSTLSKHIRDLNKIRAAVPALSLGQYQTAGVESDGPAFVRRYKDSTIDSLALVSVSEKASFNNIPNGTYVDVVSGKRIIVNNNKLVSENTSKKGSLICFVLENAQTGTLGKIASESTYLL